MKALYPKQKKICYMVNSNYVRTTENNAKQLDGQGIAPKSKQTADTMMKLLKSTSYE
jgi:hypothetical protein